MTENNLERGAELIRLYAKKLPETPGVYRMLSEKGEALYVGKAKALKKRVITYANTNKLPIRLQRMVSATMAMEFVHTHTEVEALLLESNLIKKLKPRYNVLLRDDKSFPYILLTAGHDFPQVKKHRGARKAKGEYFGPFANAGAVNRTIAVLQRAFKLRNCTDSYFSNRKRPCLQYHIKRCTGPCVGKVSKKAYGEQIAQAQAFLSGESRAIQEKFANAMQKASDAEDYETAGEYRDRIKALTSIQARQDINIEGLGNVDVLALAQKGGKTCVQVFFFRAGQNFGGHAYFPRASADDTPEHILSVFMAQFYENKPVPGLILTSHTPKERKLLEEALGYKDPPPLTPPQAGGERSAAEPGGGRKSLKVTISQPERGKRKRLMEFALRNAGDALDLHLAQEAGQAALLHEVAELFEMEEPPQRIEIYDNSHISGTNMVGGMVVAGPEGFRKSAYRKFNIKHADAADDVGMMREVMERRFGRLLKESSPALSSPPNPPACGGGQYKESPPQAGGKEEEASPPTGGEEWPDLLLIDGGLGQFNAVKEVLSELGIFDDLTVVAISKGPDRNAGREKFFLENKKPFQLPENDAVLHYLQRLRDEAHRFAIGAHRTRRKGDISKSPLDDVPGVGAARKKALLKHFGSGKEVTRAGLKDLESVEGISKALAEKIYNHFHDNG